ncbi:GldG family protein, partial [Patescibacteria group bacterium]|nr:GldG family protein [Patescibacteria group bacterium]
DERDAQTAGIQKVQFNSVGSGKFEVQSGVLGVVIRFGDKTESIPFISDPSDLEYQLTRRIRKITGEKEQVIGIIQSGYSQQQILNEILNTQYQVKTIAEGEKPSVKDLSALIAIDDGNSESSASAGLKEYLAQGGKALILTNGVSIDQRSLSAQKNSSAMLSTFKDYGVTINSDLVYDLQLSEVLSFNGQGGQRYLARYPYWLRALPAAKNFPPLATVKSISLGWPSSLSLTAKSGIMQKKLLITGSNAGRVENNFDISPQGTSALTPNDKDVLLAVLIEKDDTRFVVVGSASMVDDQFLTNNRDNVAFVSNIIDYLAVDKDLASIPSKSVGRAIFEFKSPNDIIFVQYGNLLIPPLIVVIFAVLYLRKRRSLTRRIYVK